MSGERLPIWDDPDVIDAMREGRELSDICCLSCPACGRISYYNQGSSFSCADPDCGKSHYVLDEQEYHDGVEGLYPDPVLTLEDVLDAECSDYP